MLIEFLVVTEGVISLFFVDVSLYLTFHKNGPTGKSTMVEGLVVIINDLFVVGWRLWGFLMIIGDKIY